MKNYPNHSPMEVDRIAARAQRMFPGMHFWADYNDVDFCMSIFWRKDDDPVPFTEESV